MPMGGYLGILCVLAVAGLLQRNEPMLRTSLVILANWLANTAFVTIAGVYDPWVWFMLTDAIAAGVVLMHPAGRMQASIGWIYISMILVHFGYWFARNPDAILDYLYILDWLAVAQIGLMVLWGMGGVARRIGHHLHRADRRLSQPSRMAGVDE